LWGRVGSTRSLQATEGVRDGKYHPTYIPLRVGTRPPRIKNISNEATGIVICFLRADYAVPGFQHSLLLLLHRETLIVVHPIGETVIRLRHFRSVVRQDR